MPPIPGLAETHPLTTEAVFDLMDAPRRMAIIGGGPVGCELAQAFQRLGVNVTLFHDQARLLEREDPDASAVVEKALQRDGVGVVPGARIGRVDARGTARTIAYESGGMTRSAEVDAILVSTGRIPNVEGLHLQAARVEVNADGAIRVDDFLRTTNPRVYACGDVCLPWKFTHAADAAARIVVQNALFAAGPIGRRRLSALTMSWCTFTDPEVAHAGLSAREARDRGIDVETFTQPLASLDRAMTDSATEGDVKLQTARGTVRIVGAPIDSPLDRQLIR
jgi:pyruvate/2-oxoglutarate dehydrogenase complex dihydrolipoamide dehydrogenase (E3) component